VYVIRHDLQAVNRYLQLLGLLLKQSLETLVHGFNQDWPEILGTPHPMIFEAEYGTCILSLLSHQQEYIESTGLRQTKGEHARKKGRIPLALKATVSCGRIYGCVS
jgi:hypothetical protein